MREACGKVVDYRGLKFTKTDLQLHDERFDQDISFEGAIAHEMLQDPGFEYYLLPQFDLNELLEALETTQEALEIYLVEGQLLTNRFKQKEFKGYYIFAKWGLVPLQVETEASA